MPPYKKDFEPIALPGEYIKIFKKSGDEYYRVKAVEPLPAYIHDFGTLNPGESKEFEVKELYLNQNQLAQYRMMLIDDFQIYIKQPPSSTRWATQEGQFYVSKDISSTDPTNLNLTNLTEFYVLEDNSLKFVVTNPSTNTLNTTRVLFAGFKFLLEKVSEEPEKYTTISIDSLD